MERFSSIISSQGKGALLKRHLIHRIVVPIKDFGRPLPSSYSDVASGIGTRDMMMMSDRPG